MVRSAVSRRADIAAVGLAPAIFTQETPKARAGRCWRAPPSDSPGFGIIQRLTPVAPSSKLARNRQRRYQLAAIALRAQLGRELVGDVPGENDGALGLVGEQP